MIKAFIEKMANTFDELVELAKMRYVGVALGECWCQLWAKGNYEATEDFTTFVRNKYISNDYVISAFDQTKEKFLYKWDNEN